MKQLHLQLLQTFRHLGLRHLAARSSNRRTLDFGSRDWEGSETGEATLDLKPLQIPDATDVLETVEM